MKNQMWLRIIYDYNKTSFPRKGEVINLFDGRVSGSYSLNFNNGVEQTKDAVLKLIESTRRMYEENNVEERRLELWSLHLLSITMLENVILLYDLKQ